MDSVLIVSSTDKGKEMITALLTKTTYANISTATNGADARRKLSDNDYTVIIINAPLSDEFGHTLAISVSEHTISGVMMIVSQEYTDDINNKLEQYGVVVLEKPIAKTLFYQALRIIGNVTHRLNTLKFENERLQNKIDEMRLVNRAKCVLMQYLNMSEEQAHKYIERQAMNLRITRRQEALNILKTYESY